MKTRTKLSLGLSALVLGGSMVGCTGNQGGIASAGTRNAAIAAKAAAGNADRARAALANGQAPAAIAAAEAAVQLMPQNGSYRALLGQGYLKAGRFDSARTAFADALALEPTDGRTALNLALSQIALGDWQAARATLDANHEAISPVDRGLAIALAGDPDSGAQLLTDVIRGGQGSPKARQNLALALALAGQWQGARVVAAADMSPADVDARLEQWAVFAKPKASSDQVASLLGVQPAQDPGLPIALALTAPVQVGAPIAEAPVAVANAEPGPVVASVVPEVASVPVKADSKPVETPLLRADPQPIKVAIAAKISPSMKAATSIKGKWYVQVGAFRNAAVARDGWRGATRRMPALARTVPVTARFAGKGGAFYRLAFGGFGRSEADSTCRRYRATGGACFVRAAAGDQIASWAAKPVQLASR